MDSSVSSLGGLDPARGLMLGAVAACALAVFAPLCLAAQDAPVEWLDRLQWVVPAADRFSDRDGDPPVFRAYQTDPETGQAILIGYAFLTSDFPPEQKGFTGPIEALVGMDLQGVLTGILVTGYVESHRATRGDFLSARGFQEQFTGKRASDPFRVRRDVDGITGATITVDAMSRGIRDSARDVAIAYGLGTMADASGADLLDPITITTDQLRRLSWTELMLRGLGQQISVLDDARAVAELTLTYLRNDSIAEIILGPRMFADVIRRGGPLAQDRHLVLASLDGPSSGGLNMLRLSAIQGGDTVGLSYPEVILFATPLGGKIHQEFRLSRVLLFDRALDMTQPLTFVLDLSPGGGIFSAEYPGDRRVVDEVELEPPPATPATEPDSSRDELRDELLDGLPDGLPGEPPEERPVEPPDEPTDEPPVELQPPVDSVAPTAAPTTAQTVSPTTPVPAAVIPQGIAPPGTSTEFEFTVVEDETVLARTLARTSWTRVALLLLLLGLASYAFAAKGPGIRWATLTFTMLYLGFVDGGFLSVSHITSGIAVGPAVYLNDIPLLLIVVFTVVTTLLWGRVFCGFLCPFGALQDFLDRVVPRRFRREVPQRVHDRALYIKYGVLALILIPSLAGSRLSIFQYFEPFGTVFFLSPSLVLWVIAAGILAACVVVPRFYCRYACPLGAALGVVSFLSPFRIRRVEQCTHCKVCEVACPTGAIRGPEIDFKECVRCNICESNLIERAGVCRHDIEEVERRLVQVKGRPEAVLSDG